MSYRLGKKSLEHMFGVDDRLQKVAHRAIEITKIDFGVPETGGVRADKVQYELFASGVSKCDGKSDRSKHQDRLALDFYAYVDGKASWEPEYLAQIAAAFLQASIELGIPIFWGGLFKSFNDMPHVELLD